MADTLKDILGAAYTDEIESKLNAYIGAGYVARADFNARTRELKEVKGQLAGLQNASGEDGWEAKYNALKTDSETKMRDAESRYNGYRLDNELRAAKVRNAKAVRALLDSEKIKYGDDKIDGLADQLDAIRKSDPYLFDADTGAGGAGTGFPAGGDPAPGAGAPPARPPVI